MNCLECQELVQKRLDGDGVAASEALEQHLNQCAVCREQHAASVRLFAGLKALPRPRPAPGLAQALGAKVIQDRRQRRDKLGRRVFLTMALAASVMLMLLLAYYWLPGTGNGKIDIVEGVPKKEVPLPKEKAPEPYVKKPEPRNALTTLTERWVDTTRDHAKVVLVAANLDAMENLPAVDKLPPIDPGVREASQEVSDGVRTVTRNARKAFDFFAREFPMPEVGEQKN